MKAITPKEKEPTVYKHILTNETVAPTNDLGKR